MQMEKAKLSEKDRYILRLDHWVEVTQANWRNVIKIRIRTPTAKDFQTATRDGTRKLLRCLFFQRRAPCLHDSDEEPKCSGSLVLFRHPPLLVFFFEIAIVTIILKSSFNRYGSHTHSPYYNSLGVGSPFFEWTSYDDGLVWWSCAGRLGRTRLSTCGARGPIRCGQWSPEQNIMQPWGQSKENKIKDQEMIKRMRRMRSQDLDCVQPGPLSRQNWPAESRTSLLLLQTCMDLFKIFRFTTI